MTNNNTKAIPTKTLDNIQFKLCGASSSLAFITNAMATINESIILKENPYIGLDEILTDIKNNLDDIYDLTDL